VTGPATDTYPARPVPGDIPAWTFPGAVTGALGNGMGTIHCEMPGRRLAALRLVLDAGALREPAGRDGVASLTAAAILEGTARRGATEFAGALERIGASLYASADLTALRIALDAPVSRLPAALDLLAEALLSAALNDGDIRRLGRERLDEIAQEDADPAARAARELRAVMFASGSRASRPTGGDPGSVAALTGEHVRGYHAALSPAEATVVTAGDLAGSGIESLIADALGAWAAPERPLGPADAAEPVSGARIVIVDRPGAVQTQLRFGHHAPGRDDPSWAALGVVANVLGGGLSSRLNSVLREEKGYTYGMHAGLARLRGRSLFVVEGAVHTEVTGPAVADALAAYTSILDGITEEECTRAIRSLADGAPAQYETSRAVAAELADAAAHGLPADQPRRHLAAVRATTPASALDAYTRHIDTKALSLVAVGDAEQIRGPLEDLGYAEVTVVS
jgi:predicted Zn-dependent peptidase